MRITACTNHLYVRGGAERVMFEEIEWLQAHGHDVTAFGQRPGACVEKHSDLFPPSIDYESPGWLRRVRIAPRLIYSHSNRKRMLELCERVRPEIVHFHNIYGGLTTAVLDACHAARIPFVLTLHDYKLVCPSYLMFRGGRPCSRCMTGAYYNCLITRCHKRSIAASAIYTLETYFNRWLRKYLRAAALIAPSRFLMRQMCGHGVPPELLRYVPNGVDVARYEPSECDRGYALYYGRVSPEKGIETLIRAAVQSRMRLRVIGNGPALPELRELAAGLGAADIQFDGHQTGASLAQAIRDAACVVVPSECYENASMVVLEAMAYAKPVIASDIGGIGEQVLDGVTGILFQAGSVPSLAAAMKAVESKPTMRRHMGQAGRRRVETHFSLANHCHELLRVYESAISGEGSRRV